ncbi:MAG: LPS assembly lipoprotein LptE [Woeseiaceae bacterium]
MSSRIFILVTLGLVSSCGFQMQGALSTPAEMERTYISTVDHHSLFYRELRAQLQTAGVELVDTAGDSTATISILIDETDQRVLSVSARNVPTEYEVYYTVQYAIDTAGDSLVDPQTLTITRDYTYDSTLVLGKAREEELLREAAVKDLVRIVLKKISIL